MMVRDRGWDRGRDGEGIGKGLGEESWRGKLGKGKVKENGKTKGGHDKYPGNVILSSIFRIDKNTHYLHRKFLPFRRSMTSTLLNPYIWTKPTN